jgi:hypothetical protein
MCQFTRKDDSEMDLNEMVWEAADWIYVGQVMAKQPIFVSMKMNIVCPK